MAWLARGALSPSTIPLLQLDLSLWNQINWFHDQNCIAVIEKVTSSPQMGVASSFKFGCGYGKLLMALTAAGISFREVRPQVWMRALGIPPRKVKKETQLQFKDRLRGVAQQMFPGLSLWEETLGEQRAVCDALLIAEYGRKEHSR